jgi:hypothetical protein
MTISPKPIRLIGVHIADADLAPILLQVLTEFQNSTDLPNDGLESALGARA